MESFFATLKKELVHREHYQIREQARASLFYYLEVFYNRQRRHSALGFHSPHDYEQSLLIWLSTKVGNSKDTLPAQLAQTQQWQRFYNQERIHSSSGSQTPLHRLREKRELIPSRETVLAAYGPAKEQPIKNTYSLWVPLEKLTPKDQRAFRKRHPSL